AGDRGDRDLVGDVIVHLQTAEKLGLLDEVGAVFAEEIERARVIAIADHAAVAGVDVLAARLALVDAAESLPGTVGTADEGGESRRAIALELAVIELEARIERVGRLPFQRAADGPFPLVGVV